QTRPCNFTTAPKEIRTPLRFTRPARSASFLARGTPFASFSCGALWSVVHRSPRRGPVMLVLSRRIGEEIVIDNVIRVKVGAIQGNRVKLGFVAPEEITVHRDEIHRQRMQFADAPGAQDAPMLAH